MIQIMNLNIIQIIILNVQKCKKAYFVEKGRNRCTIGIFSKEGWEKYKECVSGK